jgi:curved DNA-binding protein CbpA
MPDPYTVLGVPPDADDDAVRRRYLELARTFPPEQHPEKFAAVRAAYDQVKTLDARAAYRLFEAGKEDTIDALIEEAACRTPRPRVSLHALTAAQSG